MYFWIGATHSWHSGWGRWSAPGPKALRYLGLFGNFGLEIDLNKITILKREGFACQHFSLWWTALLSQEQGIDLKDIHSTEKITHFTENERKLQVVERKIKLLGNRRCICYYAPVYFILCNSPVVAWTDWNLNMV